MTQSRKIVASGLALCLFSSFGCAGTGLRNMFSRNETEGYKSLAELEAEEAQREAKGKDADSQGPRFASWLPFGKKATDDSEAVASNDSTEDSDETTKGGWWQNPFRKNEPVDSDPFLTQDQPEEKIAGKEKSADRKTREAIAAADSKGEKSSKEKVTDKEAPVKAVSKTSKKSSAADDAAENEEKDEDSLLVEKFEKHFQQNTAEAVDAVDDAEPLIVAGKTKANAKTEEATSEFEKSKTATTSVASDKLAELERLLAEKKTLSAKRIDAKKDDVVAKQDDAVAKKSAQADEVSDAFFEKISGNRDQVVQADRSFDSLFGDASANAVTSNKPAATTASSNQTKSAPTSTRKPGDMNVADADALFGLSPAVKSAKPTSPMASREFENRPKSGGWSGSEERGDGFGWTQSQLDSNDRSVTTEPVSNSREERFAAAFSAARNVEAAPTATLKDAPEPGGTFAAVHRPQRNLTDRDKAVSRKNPVRAVSATRELAVTPTTSGGSTRDEFFTKPAPTPNAIAAAAPTVPESEDRSKSSAGLDVMPSSSGRTWILLVCGIIVAALLFAPGRKKPIGAMHSAV